MDFIDLIKSRRSVREFKNKKPDWRDIIEAIHSSQYAPMSGDIFSLKFLIIDEKEKITKIAKYSEQEFIQDVKYIVVVLTDGKKTKLNFHEAAERYLPLQAGASIQNLMLHLTSVGLSTCWISHFYEDKVKTLLKIPKEIKIEALLPIGFAKKKLKRKTKKDPYNILYFNKWGNQRMKKENSINA